MIPRKIHYCWFGGSPKPAIIEKCIASWRRFCPDWEIIEWNEANYDVHAYPYMQEAYEAKKWAFVSDVARLDIVSKHGGVYLDTDVELLASIDELIEWEAFFFFETERKINTGMGFGAESGHPAVEAMLRFYEGRSFLKNGKPDLTPCPAGNTKMLLRVFPKLKRDGRTQVLGNVLLLGLADYEKYMKHYGTALWAEGPRVEMKGRVYKNTWLKRFLKRPQMFDFVEKYFGERGLAGYTFLVYDLPEMGVGYFMKRLLWKMTKGK